MNQLVETEYLNMKEMCKLDKNNKMTISWPFLFFQCRYLMIRYVYVGSCCKRSNVHMYIFYSFALLQTFNFADNGRHLANQNYRICMRQEVEMCSIVYQPCDIQSFRIGPSLVTRLTSPQNGVGSGMAPVLGADTNTPLMDNASLMNQQQQMQMLSDDVSEMTTPMNMIMNTMATSTTATISTSQMVATNTPATTTAAPLSMETTGSTTASPAADDPQESSVNSMASTTPMAGEVSPSPSASPEITTSTSVPPAADDPEESSVASILSTANAPSTSNAPSTTTTPSQLSDDVEGSGAGEDGDTRLRPTPPNVSKRPRPTRGGFDLLGFLRTAFEMRFRNARQGKYLSERQKRQFYSNCRDRITMPCIVEDFIGTGLGPLPGCEPVHCGMQFCSNGMWPCRIESTVTPFYVGIHFGDGTGKGSPEDNIGACLRYQQVQCM